MRITLNSSAFASFLLTSVNGNAEWLAWREKSNWLSQKKPTNRLPLKDPRVCHFLLLFQCNDSAEVWQRVMKRYSSSIPPTCSRILTPWDPRDGGKHKMAYHSSILISDAQKLPQAETEYVAVSGSVNFSMMWDAAEYCCSYCNICHMLWSSSIMSPFAVPV